MMCSMENIPTSFDLLSRSAEEGLISGQLKNKIEHNNWDPSCECIQCQKNNEAEGKCIFYYCFYPFIACCSAVTAPFKCIWNLVTCNSRKKITGSNESTPQFIKDLEGITDDEIYEEPKVLILE